MSPNGMAPGALIPDAPRSWATIRLVAEREIITRLRGKAYRISAGLLVVVVVAAILLMHFLAGTDSATKVVVVSPDPGLSAAVTKAGDAAGKEYRVSTATDRTAAQDRVKDGSAKVALVHENSRYTVIFKDKTDATVQAVLQGAVTQRAIAARLDPATIANLNDAIASSQLTSAQAEKKVDHEAERLLIAYVAVMLLSIAIMTGGQLIAQGVVEEKSSRVVEILLATIRPVQLLWGKIIGCGLLAIAQIVLAAIAGLAAAMAVGELKLGVTAWGIVGLSLMWFVLGFGILATLYAAAASLVSRQEDLGSATTPLTILSMGMIYAGVFGISFADTTWVKVLSYIPPFSATLQPMLAATGNLSPAAAVTAALIAAASCGLAVVIAGRTYRNAVLHTGASIKWRDALTKRER